VRVTVCFTLDHELSQQPVAFGPSNYKISQSPVSAPPAPRLQLHLVVSTFSLARSSISSVTHADCLLEEISRTRQEQTAPLDSGPEIQPETRLDSGLHLHYEAGQTGSGVADMNPTTCGNSENLFKLIHHNITEHYNNASKLSEAETIQSKRATPCFAWMDALLSAGFCTGHLLRFTYASDTLVPVCMRLNNNIAF
jgi:hypothetical protein